MYQTRFCVVAESRVLYAVTVHNNRAGYRFRSDVEYVRNRRRLYRDKTRYRIAFRCGRLRRKVDKRIVFCGGIAFRRPCNAGLQGGIDGAVKKTDVLRSLCKKVGSAEGAAVRVFVGDDCAVGSLLYTGCRHDACLRALHIRRKRIQRRIRKGRKKRRILQNERVNFCGGARFADSRKKTVLKRRRRIRRGGHCGRIRIVFQRGIRR